MGAAAAMVPLAWGTSASASVTIRDLVELTDVDGLSISPDGRFAVFRTERADVDRNSYVLRWYSVDLTKGSVHDIGSGGDPIYADPGLLQPEKPLWASDGRTIIVRALRDRAVGLWRADVGGAGMVPLVTGDADVLDYSMTPERTALLYETGATRDQISRAEQQEYDSGILIDSTVDLSQNLFRGASINGRMSTQRLVGYWYVRDGLLWRTPRQQRRLDLQTGSDVPVGEPAPVPPFTLPSRPPPVSSSDAAGNAVASDWSSGRGVVSATLADARKLICRDPVCAAQWVSSFVWLPHSRDVLMTFLDLEHRQSLYLWDVAANRLRKVVESDGLLSGDRNNMTPCAVSTSGALCVAAAAASPPRLEWIDFANGQRRVLFDPNAGLRAAYHARVHYLRWGIGGGKQAGGVLMLPETPARAPAPLYVNYYRCDGFLRGGVGDEWPIPQLLEAGYAIACINSVPLPGAQDGVKNYETGLDAVRGVIDRLAKERIVDPSKVAMGGLSFGSEVAFWTALHSDLLSVLSVSSLQLEPAGYWLSAMPGSDIPATMLRVWGLGDPDKTAGRWRQVAPALNAEEIRIPVLFQLPENEARRIPELYARLAAQGTPAELYAFPDEAHLKLQPRHRLAVYGRNLDWFRYWLEDYRDPDRTKADQYRRWDDLRSRWKASPARPSTIGSTAPSRPSR